LAWILGPAEIIEDLGRAASGIDGGPSLPIQRAAIQLFEPSRADMETQALREVFSRKQNITLNSLRDIGMTCSEDSNGTFYIWADISNLPPPLNSADFFFNEALKAKVITVPGSMFNIHPGKPKTGDHFSQYIRFSYGPEEENLVMGLQRITELIQSHK
jgi:aspartate/methionine/tyrosine aminotransferase